MSKYNMYQSYSDVYRNKIRKLNGLSKNVDVDNLMYEYSYTTQDKKLAFFQEVLFGEYMFETSGKHVVFPENENVIELMLKSKYKIKDYSIITPAPCFQVAFPKKLKLPGVLVMFDSIKNINAYINRFSQKNQYNTLLVNNVETQRKHIHIYFQSPINYLNSISLNIVDLVPYINRTKPLPFVIEDENRKKLAEKILRAVVGLCLYIKTCPDKIIEGVPQQQIKSTITGVNPNKLYNANIHLIKQQETSSTKCMHYRSCCFKTLINERYKRNEDGTCKTIFVKSCLVKRGTPITVLETQSKKGEMQTI